MYLHAIPTVAHKCISAKTDLPCRSGRVSSGGPGRLQVRSLERTGRTQRSDGRSRPQWTSLAALHRSQSWMEKRRGQGRMGDSGPRGPMGMSEGACSTMRSRWTQRRRQCALDCRTPQAAIEGAVRALTVWPGLIDHHAGRVAALAYRPPPRRQTRPRLPNPTSALSLDRRAAAAYALARRRRNGRHDERR